MMDARERLSDMFVEGNEGSIRLVEYWSNTQHSTVSRHKGRNPGCKRLHIPYLRWSLFALCLCRLQLV